MTNKGTILKVALKNDLSLFTKKVFHTVDPAAEYLHNWHIELISEYLLACQRGELTRLIINIPPRHMKSISVAVAFPAWLLGHNPSEKIMCASYSQELTYKHSLDCRLIVENEWYKDLFSETKLVDDQNTKRKFVTTARGHRIATSIGATATGEGANYLIVDDPLSAQQGQSEAFRNNANQWFDQTFVSRLNDKKKGVIIVIMQRLHENDLTGHLLKKGGWEHLCLPMIAEQDEVLQYGLVRHERKAGEFLHSERMGQEEIDREKHALGAYAFSGQYQQKPSPEGGGEFRREWLMYYDQVHHDTTNNYIVIDPAHSKKKSSDYTGVAVWGVGEDKNFYLVDAIRDKLNLRERCEAVFEMHRKYKPLMVGYESYGLQADIEHIQDEMSRQNYRFHIEQLGGKLSKEDRIRRLVPDFYSRKIYFPRMLFKTLYNGVCTDIISELIDKELLAFPVGLHDDLLDAMSRIYDLTISYPGKNKIDYYALYRR